MTHVVPIPFDPIMDRSEAVAQGFILHKHEPVGRVFIQHRAKHWRCKVMLIFTAQRNGNFHTISVKNFPVIALACKAIVLTVILSTGKLLTEKL